MVKKKKGVKVSHEDTIPDRITWTLLSTAVQWTAAWDWPGQLSKIRPLAFRTLTWLKIYFKFSSICHRTFALHCNKFIVGSCGCKTVISLCFICISCFFILYINRFLTKPSNLLLFENLLWNEFKIRSTRLFYAFERPYYCNSVKANKGIWFTSCSIMFIN